MLKKVLLWAAVAFAAFWLLSAPTEAAAAVRTAGGGLADAAASLVTFMESVFR